MGVFKKNESFTEQGISTLGQQDNLHKQIHSYENTFKKPFKVKGDKIRKRKLNESED